MKASNAKATTSTSGMSLSTMTHLHAPSPSKQQLGLQAIKRNRDCVSRSSLFPNLLIQDQTVSLSNFLCVVRGGKALSHKREIQRDLLPGYIDELAERNVARLTHLSR